MGDVDLSDLRENQIIYCNLAAELEDKYKCSWDDALHDSYGRYVRLVLEKADDIKQVSGKAELLLQEIKELEIPDLVRQTDSLCSEVDDI